MNGWGTPMEEPAGPVPTFIGCTSHPSVGRVRDIIGPDAQRYRIPGRGMRYRAIFLIDNPTELFQCLSVPAVVPISQVHHPLIIPD